MSNWLAIATTTETLRRIAEQAAQEAVPGALVNLGRPENPTNGEARVRLYLYMVTPNSALRNGDLRTRNADGELVQRPQIALDLHYLMTFYGDEPNLVPQRMMGAVVRDLHAKPVLTRPQIKDVIAGGGILAKSDLDQAVEQVKFSPVSLSTEEMSKLWSVFFQTPHALSVVYQGSVVLITTELSAEQTRPVLRRGEHDQGAEAQLGPFPVLESIRIGNVEDVGLRQRPPSFSAAQLGHHLTLTGRNLAGEAVSVRFVHERLVQEKQLTVSDADRKSDQVCVVLPNDVAAQTEWAAGLYNVSTIVKGQNKSWTTNLLGLAIAPRIVQIAPPTTVPIGQNVTETTLKITVSPHFHKHQSATLHLFDREVTAEPIPAANGATTDTITFKILNAPKVQNKLVTLRIDGVDSLPFKREKLPDQPPRLVFDPDQMVTIP